MHSKNILLDAPVQETLETTLLGEKDRETTGQFEDLMKQGNSCLKAQEFEKAAACFEKARRLDVVREKEVMEGLAEAYLGWKDEIRALYWFSCAAEEADAEKFESQIMELYQTGVAGNALKEEAEEYFAAISKAEEQRRKAERKAELIQNFGPEKVTYPKSLVDKMNALIEFEDMYIKENELLLKRLKNAGKEKDEWKERVAEQDKIIKEDELLRERYHALVEDCKQEKEKCGVTGTFFFDIPLSRRNCMEDLHRFRKPLGYSIFNEYEKEDSLNFYTDRQGYKIKDEKMCSQTYHIHVPAAVVNGELDFFFLDEYNRVIPSNQKDADISNADLYTNWDCKGKASGNMKHWINFIVDDEKYINLYCDWDYVKEHKDEKYEVAYLWDTDLLLVYRYDDYRDTLESLDAYYKASPTLTEIYLPIGEGRLFQNMKESVIGWGYENHNEIKDGEVYDMRFMKKAVIISHEDKIIAILLPKIASDVIKVHTCRCDVDCPDGKVRKYDKVQSIRRERGANWEYFAASTMKYVASKLQHQLKPFDITEQKPEGMPDDLWRYWMKCRYTYQKK